MKIAIVRLTALGDVIHTAAALQFVKELRPDLDITWFVEERLAAILESNPHIDRLVPLPLHALKKKIRPATIREAWRRIREAGPFDLVVDVQGLIKSAVVARIAGARTAGADSASAKEGVASLLYRHRYPIDCGDIAPMRFATLLGKALNLSIDREMMAAKRPYLFPDDEKVDPEINTHFLKEGKNLLIVTGTSHPSKTYPAHRWVEVIQRLKEYNILLIAGNDQERKEAATIAAKSGATLLPPMDLNTLKYAVGMGDLLIGGDTGPTHIAWAMNRPSVVLFGSTPSTMMFQTPVNVAITSKTRVHPCRFDKSDRSIATIDPEEVAQTARKLLA